MASASAARVRTLSLRIRSARAEAKQPASDFMAKALARAVESLHEPRAVFVHRLQVDLRMLEAGLTLPSEVDAVASLLRAHLETLVSEAAQRSVSPERDVVVFASAAAWRASRILAVATEADAWYFADLASSAEPGACLGLPDPELARATLTVLVERSPEFERALARERAPVLVAWLQTLERIAAVAPSEVPPHARVDRLVAAVLASARAIVAGRVGRVVASMAATAQGAEAAQAEHTVARAATACPSASQPTRIARAAYLLSIWLELDTARVLYEAGLREGIWFAHALAQATKLASPNDDVLCVAVGGESWIPALPEIAADRVAQACAATLTAWFQSVARRRLEGVALTLAVERWGGARWLVVRGTRCDAPVGAFLADSIERAEAALRQLTSLAPSPCVLRASRALVELDRSGRVLPVPSDARAFVPAACSALLVETIAGAAREQYALRGGQLEDDFAVDGRVSEDDALVLVEMDVSAISLDLREAGLDGSPGWLPWLGKKLEVEFTGLEAW
jgi:hypothetical protein